MLNKLEDFNIWLSSWFEWIGFIAMLVIMTITCIDVVGSKVFNTPLLGALDIVVLCQLIAISFAGSITLLAARHIEVEFFFDLLPRFLQIIIAPIIHLLGMVFFILAIWRLVELGYSFQQSGEYSPTAYIPLFPFAYAAAIAIVPLCLCLLHKFLKSLTGKTH